MTHTPSGQPPYPGPPGHPGPQSYGGRPGYPGQPEYQGQPVHAQQGYPGPQPGTVPAQPTYPGRPYPGQPVPSYQQPTVPSGFAVPGSKPGSGGTLTWVGIGAAGVMLLSGFLPWATSSWGSVNGTAGDGWFLIIGGVAAVVFGFLTLGQAPAKVRGSVFTVTGVLGTLVTLGSILNISTHSTEFLNITPGAGIILGLLSALGLGAVGIIGLIKKNTL